MVTRRRRRRDNNYTGKMCISMIVLAFVAVISVQIIHLYQKDQEYILRQAELEEQLLEQQERQQELSPALRPHAPPAPPVPGRQPPAPHR